MKKNSTLLFIGLLLKVANPVFSQSIGENFKSDSSITTEPIFEYKNQSVTNIKQIKPDGESSTLYQNNSGNLRTSGVVGSLPGSSGVSTSGATTYSIPIFVSPGTNGMQPNLAINYNSQAGNGYMGIGWSISGLSAITRGPKDYFHFGVNSDGVDLDGDDRFYLDGSLLVATNGGVYGANGTIYHTENETFSQVTSNASAGNGPRSFTVKTKDGGTIVYGNTGDSRVEAVNNAQGTVMMWRINKITDANGNYMTFTYIETPGGESLIKTIDYTGNSGLIPYNTIEFNYTGRTDGNSVYVAGSSIPMTQLLSSIFVKSDGNTIRKYVFGYNNNFYSHLSEIQYYGLNNTQVNSTVISWGTVGSQININQVFPSGAINDPNYWWRGDFNGDGIQDLIRIVNHNSYSTSDQLLYYLFDRNGNIFSSGSIYPALNDFAPEKSVVADINGDGKDEFVMVYHLHQGGYNYGALIQPMTLLNNNFLSLQSSTINTQNIHHDFYSIIQGDYDGNGITDLLIRFNSAGSGTCTNCTDWSIYSYNPITQSNYVLWSGPIFSWSYVKPMDFNGDGKTDLMITYSNGNNSYTKIVELFNGGYNTLYYSGFPTIWHWVATGDFNGDGKTDLLTWNQINHINLSLSMGTDFLPEQQLFGGITPDKPDNDERWNNFYVGDFNGDGKDDFAHWDVNGPVGQNGTQILRTVYYSKGNGNFDIESYIVYGSAIYDSGVIPGDFNGDGKTDLFQQEYTIINGSSWWTGACNLYTFHQNEKLHLVQSITNGYDVVDHFSYQPLTELAVNTSTGSYVKGTGAQFPVFDFQGAMHVVNHSWQSDPFGNTLNDIVYDYEGAKIHRQGRGFLCFSKIKSLDVNSLLGRETYNSYFTDFYYSYTSQIWQRAGSGGFIYSTMNYTNDKLLFGNGIYMPFIKTSVQNDILKTVVFTHNYTYDVNGNLTNDDLSTNHNFQSGTNYTYGQYNNWGIPNKPVQIFTSKIYPGQPKYEVKKELTYDAATGNILMEKTTPNPNGASPDFFQKDYNYSGSNYGSLHSVTTSGTNNNINSGNRTTTFQYDNRFRFLQTTTNPLSEDLARVFDPQTGNVMEETGYDNLTTRYGYDDFGRKNLEVSPRQNINSTNTGITYNWVTPGSTNVPPNASYSVNVTAPGQPYVTKYYDAFNRLLRTQTIKMKTSAATEKIFTDKIYYPGASIVTAESKPYYFNNTPEWIYQSYTITFRPFQSNDNGRITTHYYYSSNYEQVNDPANRLRTYYYNDLGDLTQSHDFSGTVDYLYNSMGKPFSIATGNCTSTMQYDWFGNQTELVDPDAGKTNYTYNVYGELLQQHQLLPPVIYNMLYNDIGQIISKDGPDGLTTYSYMAYQSKAANAIKEVNKTNGTSIAYTYDQGSSAVGDLLSVEQFESSGNSFLTQYHYDAFGNNDVLTYPSGYQIKNNYQADGFLTSIEEVNNPGVAIWTRGDENELGQPINYVSGNNNPVITDFTYDSYHFPTQISASVNGVVGFNEGYVFNPNYGTLTSRTNNLNTSLTESFTYDHTTSQLLKSSAGSGIPVFSINYLPEGNFNTKDDVGQYIYNNGRPHAVSELDCSTAGAIPKDPQLISYTPFNKVEDITEGNFNLHIDYAQDNDRIKSSLYDLSSPLGPILTKTKYFIGNYEKIETSGSSKEIHYINSPYGLVATMIRETPLGGSPADKLYFIVKDYLGSIRVIYDDGGTVVEENNFDAWGRLRNPADWTYNNVNSNMLLERGYTGHEYLPEFALINMNGRFYDPVVCKMLSPDNFNNNPTSPLGFNRYAYANNNPLMFTDPDGHCPLLIIAAVAFLSGAMNVVGNMGSIHNFGQGLAAFGIGAGIGALSALTYGAASVGQTGFLAGFLTGSMSAVAGDVAMQVLNGMAFNSKFSFTQLAITGISSGLGGGIDAGNNALGMGANFWTGIQPPRLTSNDASLLASLGEFIGYQNPIEISIYADLPTVNITASPIGAIESFARHKFHAFVNSVTIVATGVWAGIANQVHNGYMDYFHSDEAYSLEPFKPYRFDYNSWSFEEHRSFMSENLSWDDGKEVMSASANLVIDGIGVPYKSLDGIPLEPVFKTAKPLFNKYAPKVFEHYAKEGLTKGRDYILNSIK